MLFVNANSRNRKGAMAKAEAERSAQVVCYLCRESGIICYGHPQEDYFSAYLAAAPEKTTTVEENIVKCMQREPEELTPIRLIVAKCQNPKPDIVISAGELRGELSEVAATLILANRSFFPWIIRVDRHEWQSLEDQNGVDITIALNQVVADLLGSSTISIQVKTTPDHFPAIIAKMEDRQINGTSNGTQQKKRKRPDPHAENGTTTKAAQAWVEQCYLVLSTNCGDVANDYVIASVIEQLLMLTLIRSGVDAQAQLLMYLTDVSPRAMEAVELCDAKDIIGRNFAPIIALLSSQLPSNNGHKPDSYGANGYKTNGRAHG